jgi:CO/xanthine dehydrogenase FAD-binding subunit
MIAADVAYIRPDTPEEAVAAWRRHPGARYLAGGTEIATSARRTAAYDLRAVLDVKRLPALRRHEAADGILHLGAALPLSEIADRNLFPLLSAVARGIADRTVRNRLTLGGNLAGLLPYREAALPLLLADALVHTLSPADGDAPPNARSQPLRAIFDKRLLLQPGELVLSFSVPLASTRLPWVHVRKTRTGPVDYPILTTAMVRDGSAYRLALAGAHPYPFFSPALDAALNSNALVPDPCGLVPQVKKVASQGHPDMAPILAATGPLRTDSRASADYRAALLQSAIRSSLEQLA